MSDVLADAISTIWQLPACQTRLIESFLLKKKRKRLRWAIQ
jgi:hypothetical protein